MESFEALGLSATLLRTVQAQEFTTPTAIQAKAIPPLLAGRDILGTAQTGEGKTAAYLLPILDKLVAAGEATLANRPRVLILTPTRELAIQIGAVLHDFTRGLRLYYTSMYGGMPFLVQRKVLEKGVHFLVATPGRLMDHISRRNLSLDKVDTLVLDEADRMLDMGFVDAVKEIAAALPKTRQTMMFSATMNREIRALAAGLLNDPVSIDVGTQNSVAAAVDHRIMRVKYPDKKPLLLHLLGRPEAARVLIFARTKAMADELAITIRDGGMKAQVIHGDKEQAERQRVLRAFRERTCNILVATDVAARGIDVPDITHVINYDMPHEADAYVHRVGRTGRAGVKGTALSICDYNEGNLMRNVERAIGQRVPVDADHPFHDERPFPGAGGGGRPTFVNNRRADSGKPRPAGRPERAAWSDAGSRPEREHRPEGEYRPERGQRPEREHRPEGEHRPDRDSRPERSARPGFKPHAAHGKPERAGRDEPRRAWREDGKPARRDGAKPAWSDDAKPARRERPRGDKPFAGKAFGDRPFAGKPYGAKAAAGKPYAGKAAPRDGKRVDTFNARANTAQIEVEAFERPLKVRVDAGKPKRPAPHARTGEGHKPGKRPQSPAAHARRATRAAVDTAGRGDGGERPAVAKPASFRKSANKKPHGKGGDAPLKRQRRPKG